MYNSIAEHISSNRVGRFYTAKNVSNHDGFMPYWKGFMKFGRYIDGDTKLSFPQDICRFDYIVFDILGSHGAFVEYDKIVGSKLIEKEWINPAFSNSWVVILKNEKPGVDCLEEAALQ
jgi:hypothetical protein